jgi:hypothetical protein
MNSLSQINWKAELEKFGYKEELEEISRQLGKLKFSEHDAVQWQLDYKKRTILMERIHQIDKIVELERELENIKIQKKVSKWEKIADRLYPYAKEIQGIMIDNAHLKMTKLEDIKYKVVCDVVAEYRRLKNET